MNPQKNDFVTATNKSGMDGSFNHVLFLVLRRNQHIVHMKPIADYNHEHKNSNIVLKNDFISLVIGDYNFAPAEPLASPADKQKAILWRNYDWIIEPLGHKCLTDEQREAIKQTYRQTNNIVQAIKHCRSITNWGLKEAHIYVKKIIGRE